MTGFAAPTEEKPEIPVEVVEKLEQLQKGDLNQLEKIKLADQLQRAGAKTEALALYEENLPIDFINKDLPPEAYMNYGTALLEKGEEQKGLSVYNTLAESLAKDSKSQKMKEILEKNVVNYFQVQEQKKKEEEQKKKENKENKENKDQKENQQGDGESQDQKNPQGKDPKDQQDKKGQGEQSKDQQDKKDGKTDEKDKKEKEKENEKGNDKDTDEKNDNDKNKDEKDKNESGNEGDGKKVPPSKMSPKLKQLMSDDRQLQLKVIEQGTRDMNRRQNRENKDW